MQRNETNDLETGATIPREKSQTELKDGRTSYSKKSSKESSRKSSQSSVEKDDETMQKDIRESAYSRKYTGEQVSEIISRRVNKLNEYIKALEMENTALNYKLKEMKEIDRRK